MTILDGRPQNTKMAADINIPNDDQPQSENVSNFPFDSKGNPTPSSANSKDMRYGKKGSKSAGSLHRNGQTPSSASPKAETVADLCEDEGDLEDLTDSDFGSEIKSSDSVSNKSQIIYQNGESPGSSPRIQTEKGRGGIDGVIGIEVSICRKKLHREESPRLLSPRSLRSVCLDGDGFRAQTNTPVSNIMEDYDGDSIERFSQGGTSVCREAMFQQALTLMSQRCTTSDVTPSRQHQRHQLVYEHLYQLQTGQQPGGASRGGGGSLPVKLLNGASPRLGKYVPSLFYINQAKPSPMPPLKAWRGFTGNVYFEPIKVKSMANSPGGGTSAKGAQASGEPVVSNKATRSQQQQHKRLSASEPGATFSDGSVDDSSNEAGYAHSTTSGPTLKRYTKNNHHSKRGAFKTRQSKSIIMDKGGLFGSSNSAVNNVANSQSAEDIERSVGRQQQQKDPVGSLCIATPRLSNSKEVQSKQQSPKIMQKKVNYNKEKICRGSQAHKVFVTTQDTKRGISANAPELTAAYVKTPMSPSGLMSPSALASEGDKENKGSARSKLPPLEASSSAKSQPETLAKQKPYVKYSRDAFKE